MAGAGLRGRTFSTARAERVAELEGNHGPLPRYVAPFGSEHLLDCGSYFSGFNNSRKASCLRGDSAR